MDKDNYEVIDRFEGSEYNPNIEIVLKKYDDRPIKALFVNEVCQSGMWLDPMVRGEATLHYSRRLRECVHIYFDEKKPKNMLVIGGAGFEIAKYLLRDYPTAQLTVVEIDPVMLEAAKAHFYLDEMMECGRLTVINDDGFNFMEETEEIFDLVVNDAFLGGIRADTNMLTDLAAEAVHRILSADGIYVINLIAALEGSDSFTFLMERDMLLRYYDAIRVYPTYPDMEADKHQNLILAAFEKKV